MQIFLSRSFEIKDKNEEYNKSDYREKEFLDLQEIRNSIHKANKEDKKRILKYLHENLVHPGINKFFLTINKYLQFENIKDLIKEVCYECKKCQLEKNYKTESGEISCDYFPRTMNDTVALDIKGPLPLKHFFTSRNKKQKNFYIIAMVDLFSRYTEIKIIYSIYSRIICNAFKEKWLNVHGPPKKCLTDNGRQFTSKEFESISKNYKIIHIKTAPYNHTGNAVVERINQEIGLVLRLTRGKSIKEVEHSIWKRINMTANTTTGYCPYEIFEDKPIFKNANEFLKVDKSKIINGIARKMCQYANKKPNKIIKYKEGDKILKRNFSPDKIAKRWKGPYEIIKLSKNNSNMYINVKGKP
ncbi:Retrovirus-related Pol polyprotein from transposon [Dictyocoela muelleri]|nr:Retrovirus-related Pol polyprotein from transposon [Dictyocoela muelleri]